ncbi:hypothetical protein P691DRAFT_723402 [Macrolepiota fuliginosa MF-IS2]|uniref:Uncharacterized protein n=1 Tax=Macrolepiota fuliginosa MF-IS2 TaxID=1400762 RepID=A0A9P5XJ01_9AGAR|nr:hypothetical protein P691DRAFT_723402 [Macrolepiota fuliginosa MF-IS2]
MSAQNNLSFPSEHSLIDHNYRPHLHPPIHDQYNNPELKASYDDLIDEYSTPYTSPHHTYTTNPASNPNPNPHHRGPSLPFSSSKSPFSSKQSDDTHDTAQIIYPPQPIPNQSDAPGFWQKVLPDSIACRLYVLAVLVETTVNLAIEGDLYLRIREVSKGEQNNNNLASRRMPVYLSVFAMAHVFQFVMAVDAVYARNTLQFLFLTVFNGLLIIYAAIQIGEVREALGPGSTETIANIPISVLTTIIPIVVAVAEVFFIALGYKIYNEFGWKVYKFLGADRNIKRMYASYQIYECLLKFDLFFWAGFSVQFIWLVLQNSDWEYYVTCAALPFSIILLVEGHLAAKHENKWMMATFMSGCVGALIYFIYKLIKVIMNINSETFHLTWKSLTVFSVIAIALLIATMVFSVMVLRNFGKGLKEARKRQHNRLGPTKHGRAASTTLNRMSIS